MSKLPGLYAPDGSFYISVIDETSLTDLYAADGSINVVVAPGNQLVGSTHPCGGWWVTVSPTPSGIPTPNRAPDGSLYVSVSPYTNGGQHVTVLSGSLTPVGGYVPTYYIYGF